MSIFATSKGEFAERMTTFVACKGRFEPQPYEPSLSRVVALLYSVPYLLFRMFRHQATKIRSWPTEIKRCHASNRKASCSERESPPMLDAFLCIKMKSHTVIDTIFKSDIRDNKTGTAGVFRIEGDVVPH